MKKTALILAAALLWVLPASAADEVVVRSFRQQIPIANAHQIHLDFPVAELNVDSAPGDQVGLDVKVKCREKTGRCADRAHELKLVYDNSGEVFKIEMKKFPKWHGSGKLHIVARITVPRDLALRAELGVGEMNIHGIAGDLTVNLGVGQVNIDLPKEAVGSVHLDTGIGEASLVASGRHYESAGLMTKELSWNQGIGRSKVNVDCGVGEIDVVLK
ncbi:MAG TPA: hypothetical protein VGS07_29395 [Thermoanaerobaculia bacterium]|jgi:hypothetical protein|nr:hypothetical protein [Thermoanaerobaculia bacterium]